MLLPTEIIAVLAHFAPAFTTPTYQKALVLIGGVILAKGRRTVTTRCGRWATPTPLTGRSIITS